MTPREAWLLRVWYDRPRRRELRAQLDALRVARLDSTPQRVDTPSLLSDGAGELGRRSGTPRNEAPMCLCG